MIGKLLLTHGQLAKELLQTGETIAGKLTGFEALSLDWKDEAEAARNKIEDSLRRLDEGDGVLILTDMFGDTPFNAAVPYLSPGRVEMVTGVNLPMVVRLGCLHSQEMSLSELAAWIRGKGRSSIIRAFSDAEPLREDSDGDDSEDDGE
jgi:PTS system mannose-specific IIA component